MTLLNRAFIVMSTATAYFLSCHANFWLLGDSLKYAQGVDWFFLPSGLRFAIVLIFLAEGALGIALASVFITYHQYFNEDYLTVIVSGALAGIAPYAARELASSMYKLDSQLTNLSAVGVFKLAVFFAFVSSVIHQLWYFWMGINEQFLDTVAVMFVGDMLGTIVVLGGLQMLSGGFRGDPK